jgi:hypothetical protein
LKNPIEDSISFHTGEFYEIVAFGILSGEKLDII